MRSRWWRGHESRLAPLKPKHDTRASRAGEGDGTSDIDRMPNVAVQAARYEHARGEV